MTKIFIAMFFFVFASGCATLMPIGSPGTITSSNSEYDGSKSVYLYPGWAKVGQKSFMKIGARKNSKMSKDEVILIVRNDFIQNFAFTTPNFFVKIDGVESKFSPLVKKTECEISSSYDVAHCTQEYMVDAPFIEKMLNAKNVIFKLDLEGNSYTEGSLENTNFMSARVGLTQFLERVKAELSTPVNKISSR